MATRADAPSRRRHELAEPDSRFVTLNGVEVHYQASGDAGPPVMLLHHFYGNAFTWRHVLAGLGPDHRVVAFDRPGFGLTQRPRRGAWNGRNPYTRGAAADLVVGLADHLAFDRPVLVGSSAGGTVALETYARHRERVGALALLSPAITGDIGPPAQLRPMLRAAPARWLASRVVRRVGRDITRERVGKSWAQPNLVTDADVDAYTRPLEVPGWPRGLWELVTSEPPPALVDVLGRIDVPTLVVAGDHDPVIPARTSRRTAEHIPGARFEVIRDAGHTPQEERPGQLVDLLRDFLQNVTAAG